MKDVHEFDNKLCESIKYIDNKINSISNIEKEDKINKFRQLQDHIIDKVAKHNLEILLNNLNYDPINKIHTEHLLLIIIDALIKNNWDKSIINLLSEQLKDMSTGFCEQGKSIRLLQIALAL